MRIRWTSAASDDLQAISDYLKQHLPHYRQPTMTRLYDSIRALKQHPGLGRPGREEGTRELLFPPLPYIAAYRVRGATIEILQVYHGARNISTIKQ